MPAKKPQKKVAVKKATASTKKRTVSKPKTVGYDQMKSFLIYKSPEPFFSTRVTRQTIYWLVLLLVIVISQAWILAIQYNLMQTLDSLQ